MIALAWQQWVFVVLAFFCWFVIIGFADKQKISAPNAAMLTGVLAIVTGMVVSL